MPPAVTPARVGNRNARKKVLRTDPAPWDSWKGLTRAGRCIKFIETQCVLPKGYGAGKPMKLAKFQKRWLRRVLAAGVRSAALSLPRGNGKSTLLAGIALWAVFDSAAFRSGAPQVPIVATTLRQAVRSVYGVALAMVAVNPEMADRSLTYSAIGDTRLAVPSNGGEMFPISHDVDGLQGLDPSLAVCDEIGFQPQDSWDALLLASGKRPGSLVVGIGTPGIDRSSALFALRSLVKEGGTLPGFLYTEYAADPGCATDDEAQWRKANPALAEGFMDISALRMARAITPSGRFRIFRLGQWVDGVQSWLGEDGSAVWDSLEDSYRLVPGAPTWAGVDVGIKRDSSAIVLVQYRPDGRLHAHCRLWVPTKEEPVDVTDLMGYLRTVCKTYQVGAISFDPRLFDIAAKTLYDEGLPMVEIPQSVERMTPVIGHTYELVMSDPPGISHDRDEAFATQVLNAVIRLNERGFTLAKSKSRGRIDAAIALSLAVDRATHKKAPRIRPPLLILPLAS